MDVSVHMTNNTVEMKVLKMKVLQRHNTDDKNRLSAYNGPIAEMILIK